MEADMLASLKNKEKYKNPAAILAASNMLFMSLHIRWMVFGT